MRTKDKRNIVESKGRGQPSSLAALEFRLRDCIARVDRSIRLTRGSCVSNTRKTFLQIFSAARNSCSVRSKDKSMIVKESSFYLLIERSET